MPPASAVRNAPLPEPGPAASALLLLACVTLGFAVRSAGLEQVFVGDQVVFPVGDAYYHLRRALFTLERFPELLIWDPLVSYPDGSWVPWPPLHDFALSLAGRWTGNTQRALEVAAAWWPAVVGALTAVPVYAAGALVGGRGVGLAAAALFALLPASVFYSEIGNADHHCTVTLLGATWLFAALAVSRTGASPRAVKAASALLVGARLALLLVWPGSVLYVAIADGSLVAVLALCGRAARLAGQAAALALSAAAIGGFVAPLGPPVGGPYSAIALSWLHPTALVALAITALGCALVQHLRPTEEPLRLVRRSAGIALGVAAAVLAFPSPREAVASALLFVGQNEPWSALNAEQLALLQPGVAGGWLGPLRYYGGLGYLLPLLPLAALWRARTAPDLREPALVLTLWSAAFGALAALQVRYGSDFAPAAAVTMALGIALLGRALGERGSPLAARLAVWVAVAAAVVPLLAMHAGRGITTWRARHRLELRDPALATPAGSLYRFAEEIRSVTPETSGFFDVGTPPEYAVLTPPNIGHAIHYVARRATPADNFGPYAGSQRFAQARRFFELRDERRALRAARSLGSRYVVTMHWGQRGGPWALASRLHREDGRARGDAPAWAHFRLVTEGPRGGRPLTDLFGRLPAEAGAVPYKLFEVVAGAVLEVPAPPGAEVEAALELRTPGGRRFVYTAEARARPDGIAPLRVPYPTEPAAPVRATGPYRVRVSGADDAASAQVSEADVRRGARIAVGSARP